MDSLGCSKWDPMFDENPMDVESSHGDTLAAMIAQEGVHVDPGGCLLPILGFQMEVLGLWPSATSELPQL